MVFGIFSIAGGLPTQASAQVERHALHLEGAGALMVGEQADRFGFGGGFGAGYELRFLEVLGLEARYAAYFFPEDQTDPSRDRFGGYHGLGGALRFHPLPRVKAGDLWLSAGANAVFTGDVARLGLEAGVGFEFQVARWLRMGPFVRYAHVLQPDGNELGSGDAGFLQFGVSLSFVAGHRQPPEDAPEDVVEEPTPRAAEAPSTDDGSEGAAEIDESPRDDEPDVAPAHEGGPSRGEPEVIELSERILFSHAGMGPTGDTASEIRSVAAQIEANPDWERVIIEGHASEPGSSDYNLRLSRQRAERVRQLLIREGIPRDRISVEAFGNTRLEDHGQTEEAHARNRRVVFKVVVRR